LLLLDTHIWFWWVEQNPNLPDGIAARIEAGEDLLAISSAAVYGLLFLREKGRIEIALPLEEWLHTATQEAGISILPVTADIARTAALLPAHHSDPLDRFLIASALRHDARVASIDSKFPLYQALSGRLVAQ
jgi:PIN domain nuclease of toxin-antitoxin system